MNTILDVVNELRQADPPLQYLGTDEDATFGKFLEFELGSWNGKLRLAPSEALNLPGRPGDRSFLYRGQAVRYSTCEASLLRGVANDERQVRARLALERFRIAELELVMLDHPFTKVARDYGFCVDYHALAQHYGIPTSLLDLTSNVEIASFFAVASWDREAQRWTPMDQGVGVLYRFDWSAFGPGYAKFFEPVGFGPGLRPARQHAWTFQLRPGVDFQKVPHVTPFEFTHSKSASEELFARFDNGSWLYPPDCLASLVEKLRDLPFVTMHAIRQAAREDGQLLDQIEISAERAADFISRTLGIDILDGYQLQPEEVDLAVARQQAATLDQHIRAMRKGWRLVRTRKSESETESI
jgi:hypothetical protein